MKSLVFLSFVITLCLSAQATAMQTEPAESPQEPTAADATAADKGLAPPADYVIGPDDVLGVLFWREPSMSGDVAVRPDGKITLPLLNEVQAAGLTPPELRAVLTKEAGRFLETPIVTIVVREIRSRNVFITGEIGQPGNYPLSAHMSVMQLIAMAGGLREYADGSKIVVMRPEGGTEKIYRFNYKHVLEGKNVRQNIQLMPGDTVVVP